jgi:hypothetical protein
MPVNEIDSKPTSLGKNERAIHVSGYVHTENADSDEAGHAFQLESGHRFRNEAGRGSDLMSATGRMLPRIAGMMFRLPARVKRGVGLILSDGRFDGSLDKLGLGGGGECGRSALCPAP